MKTFDFNPKLTSTKLNEQFAKNFGGRVNLEKFSREQLEDMRNKVRTMVFQQESSAGYNDLLTNETYQKNQAMLQLLNTRIKEMLGEDIKKLRDKMDQLSEAKAKPDFLDMDKDGNKKEPMKKAIADKKVKEDDSDRKPAKQKEREVTLPSGAKVKGRTVQGWQSQKADKNADKEKDLDEGMEPEDLGTVAEINRLIAKGMHETDAIHAVAKKYGDDPSELASFYYQHNMHEGKHAKDCDCKECTGMYEADMGKHNNKTTGFKALAKKTGGGEKGAKIAGAQFQKMKKAGQLEETNARFKHNVRFVNESLQFLLNEDEEGKAKAITAASDIVNDFTSWMQRVGQYQTKSMIELADSIKANFGAAEAEQFKQAVAASLSQTLEVLTSQREAISGAVAVLAGEATPEAPMGQEPDMGMDSEMPPEDGMDTVEPDDMNPEPAGDEFAGAEGPSSNREVRESREARFARRLAEEHSIMSKLAR